MLSCFQRIRVTQICALVATAGCDCGGTELADAALPDGGASDASTDAGLDAAPAVDAPPGDAGAPPEERGWFLFVGGDARPTTTSPSAPYCLYRYDLASGPRPILCGRPSVGLLGFAGSSVDGRSALVRYAEASDGYPEYARIYEASIEELVVVDVQTGDARVWTHYLELGADPALPSRHLLRAEWLGADRLVIHRQTRNVFPEHPVAHEIVVVTEAGVVGPDLVPDHADKELIGVLATGHVAVAIEDRTTGARWFRLVDPDDGTFEDVAEPRTSGATGSISPDRRLFAFGSTDGGDVLVARDGEGASFTVSDPSYRGETPAWTGFGDVAFIDEARAIRAWTPGEPVRLLDDTRGFEAIAQGGLAIGGGVLAFAPAFPHPSGAWLAAATRDGPPVILDRDGVVRDCPATNVPASLEWLRDRSDPALLVSVGRADPARHNRIYLCAGTEPPRELLEAHGLRGQLLSEADLRP